MALGLCIVCGGKAFSWSMFDFFVNFCALFRGVYEDKLSALWTVELNKNDFVAHCVCIILVFSHFFLIHVLLLFLKILVRMDIENSVYILYYCQLLKLKKEQAEKFKESFVWNYLCVLLFSCKNLFLLLLLLGYTFVEHYCCFGAPNRGFDVPLVVVCKMHELSSQKQMPETVS